MRGHHILDAPAGTGIAGFTVERLLGSGGQGVVYRAVRDGEVVALKLQSLEHLGGWAEREVSLLLRLKHRNVVGFRGCGLYPGEGPRWFYLAMEYVHGRTLEQWVEEENPGARRAAELLRGMARGLEAAHAARVLHRDIKESNVMVRQEDGEAVLVDFGVGDSVDAPCLTPGVLPPGTPRYRSPEALAFRRNSREGRAGRYVPSPADDLYALGVVFYWVLTARHPFAGADTPTEVEAVIHQPPVAPHVLNPRVPRVLGALCLRLLSKRAGERGSAKALCEAVDAALAEADAGWEVPLCEAHPEAPWAPAPGAGDAALEAWPPRRGRRAKPAREEAPVLVVRARPVPPPPLRAGERPRAVALLGMVACLTVAVLLAHPWSPAGGFPSMAGALPGALPSVTKTQDARACTGRACTSGSQLRHPPPPPAPCPPRDEREQAARGASTGATSCVPRPTR